MAWQNAVVTKTTADPNIYGITIEWSDVGTAGTEFLTTPFRYSSERVAKTGPGSTAFKAAAEAARDAERARLQQQAADNAQALAFMNGA